MPMKIECPECYGYSVTTLCWVDANGEQCHACGGTNIIEVYTQAEYDAAVKAAKIEGLKIARNIASGYIGNNSTVDDINYTIKELKNG